MNVYEPCLFSKFAVRKEPAVDGHLIKSITSTTTCPTVHLYRRGSASTTGTQDADAEEKVPPRSKSQASGTSSPCRKVEHVDHELLTNRFHVTHGGCAVLFNKDTFLTSRSNPSTFTISGTIWQGV